MGIVLQDLTGFYEMDENLPGLLLHPGSYRLLTLSHTEYTIRCIGDRTGRVPTRWWHHALYLVFEVALFFVPPVNPGGTQYPKEDSR